MTLLKIRQGDVGRIIGSGGKNLKALSNASQCTLEVANTGWVLIRGNNTDDMRRAVHQVSKQSLALDVGRLYLAELRAPNGERIRVAVGRNRMLTSQKHLKTKRLKTNSSSVPERTMRMTTYSKHMRQRMKLAACQIAGLDEVKDSGRYRILNQ